MRIGVGDVLDEHYQLLDLLKTSKGSARFRIAQALVALAPRAAEAYQIIYPGEELPVHPGYTRVALELERLKDYKGAIAVCELALRSGWKPEPHCEDDWRQRIERNHRRLGRDKSAGI